MFGLLGGGTKKLWRILRGFERRQKDKGKSIDFSCSAKGYSKVETENLKRVANGDTGGWQLA